MRRYWLQILNLPWQEVTRDQFIQAEHAAGFRSKEGYGQLATGGFGTATIAGKITYENLTEENLEKK